MALSAVLARQWHSVRHWPGSGTQCGTGPAMALSAALARRDVKASNIATGESQLRYALAYRAALTRVALARPLAYRTALARVALARPLAYRAALARAARARPLAYRAAYR